MRVQGWVWRRLVHWCRYTTSLRSALPLRGQRQGFRRTGEGLCANVDHLGPRVIGLAVFILVGSALDAYYTIVHIQHGGQEANPLMALALTYGYTPFVGIKTAFTGAGVWFLAVHQQFPLALQALYGLTYLYIALLVYHLALFHGVSG